MFRGVNIINLDEKGRMVMPTRYRNHLRVNGSGELIVTIDTEERCLLLYPLPDWEDIERKIESLPSFNRAARRVQRLLIGHATDVTLDSNGRILLPQPLRDYGDLQKQVVLVGQGKKFEIWNENSWEEKRESWLDAESASEDILPTDLQSLSL